MDEDGGQGVRMLRFGSQIRMSRGGWAEEVEVEVEVKAMARREVEAGGISNQNPSRIERDAVSLVYKKCQPGERSLMPRKRAEVVNVRRSMPQRIPGGRLRMKMEGVRVSFGDGGLERVRGIFEV